MVLSIGMAIHYKKISLSNRPVSTEINIVTTNKERKQFINFPYSHYKNDEYWVAPLKMEQKKLIDTEKNPFFDNADIALFLATQKGDVCGRIAAIHDRRFNDYHEAATGFFGFFECIDDETVAEFLIKVATGWLQDQGLTKILGPANPGMMDEVGILVEGFDYYPSIMMPYHKSYYDSLLKSTGLQKEMDMYAYRVSEADVNLERSKRAGKIVQKRYPDLKVREVNLKELDKEIQIVREIYNKSWSENWGFIPLTENELSALADDLKMILDPKYAHIAEMDGDPVGFSIALPDLNQALRHMNGKLFPVGIFKLLWYQRQINQLRTALMGILPKYRGKGIDALLHLKAMENGLAVGTTSSELGWVLEANEGMRHVAERIGAHIEKTYRMYSKDI